MKQNVLKKHITIITIFFMIITAACFALPQKTSAAAPVVRIGGVALRADNSWHACNSGSPAISGWTAGRYKLSTDGKTLYLDGFRFSGSAKGITSDDDLKIVTSGTNTFTCNAESGIWLETLSNVNRFGSLTLAGDPDSKLIIDSTNAQGIVVHGFTMLSGNLNTTGLFNCLSDINISGGNITVTGDADISGDMMVSGGIHRIRQQVRGKEQIQKAHDHHKECFDIQESGGPQDRERHLL